VRPACRRREDDRRRQERDTWAVRARSPDCGGSVLREDAFDPKALGDPSRDRFLVSKGHAVLIQYAALAELGVIPKEEFGKLKTLAGKLQGHPDLMTPGIEAVTGSLGQGLSIGVGMALALRLAKSPSRVFVVMGDGELAEGQLWEAAMAAARFKVDNLTAIVDRNRIQATGPTRRSSTSRTSRRNGTPSAGTCSRSTVTTWARSSMPWTRRP